MSKTFAGKFFLILGPSGVGKGTTIEMLKERHPEFYYPLSCTTRDPRPGEQDGEVYHFVSHDEFRERIEEGDLLEYAFVHQLHYYGILKAPVMEALEAGKTVVREVDYQGWESIMKTEVAPYVHAIFITTSDVEALVARIESRSKLAPEEVAHRVESARTELAGADRYDSVVETVEGDPEAVYQKIEDIILRG